MFPDEPGCVTHAEVPDIAEGLRGIGKSSQSPREQTFERLLSAGNPWRRRNARKRQAEDAPLNVRFQLGCGVIASCIIGFLVGPIYTSPARLLPGLM